MKRWLALLALLALACLVLWRIERRRAGSERLPAEPRAVPAPAQGTAALEAAGERERRELQAPHAEPASRPEPSAQAAAGPRVRGRILEGSTRAPVVGARVRVIGEGLDARRDSDAEGRFELELASGDWRWGESLTVSASLGERGRIVFRGELPLAPELELLARTRLALRGMLAGAGELGGNLAVSASEPPGADGVRLFAGSAALDAEGRFEIDAWVERVPAEFRLAFAAGADQLGALDVPAAELTSPAGATLELARAALEVLAVDEAGAPLAGAALRVKPLPLELGGELLSGTSDAEGRARFRVPPGSVELAAGLVGRAAHVETLSIPPAGASARVVLRALGARDRIGGRVLDWERKPVAGAYVSARPRTLEPECSVVATVGERSAEDGRFELEVAADGELAVVAYHRTLGFSDELAVHGGEQDLELWIAPQGSARVRIEGLPAGEAASGGYEWLLADERGERVDSGRDWGRELVLEPVRAGAFRVFVRRSGTELFGECAFTVAIGAQAEAVLELAPLARVRGTLVRADGSPAAGLAVELEGAGLPPAARRGFSAGRADGLGGFDLLLGAAEGALVVREGERELVRARVGPGQLGAVVVP